MLVIKEVATNTRIVEKLNKYAIFCIVDGRKGFIITEREDIYNLIMKSKRLNVQLEETVRIPIVKQAMQMQMGRPCKSTETQRRVVGVCVIPMAKNTRGYVFWEILNR